MWDDPVDAYAVTYQWLRNGVVIDGATSATYAITAADVNRGLSCRVNAAGFTTRPRPASPSSRRRPSSPRASRATRASAPTLTCTRGDWDDPATPYAVTYQWYRGSTAIADATAATYTSRRPATARQLPRHRRRLTTSTPAQRSRTTQATGGTPVNHDRPHDLRRPAPAARR